MAALCVHVARHVPTFQPIISSDDFPLSSITKVLIFSEICKLFRNYIKCKVLILSVFSLLLKTVKATRLDGFDDEVTLPTKEAEQYNKDLKP